MPKVARAIQQENLWDISPEETEKSYQAFLAYVGLPPHQRTMQNVKDKLNPTRTSIKVLQRWSSEHRWKERALAYAQYMQKFEHERREAEMQKQAKVWAQRRIEQVEREWETSRELFDKANIMLQMPLIKREVNDETGKVVIMPARWTLATITRFLETASKLGRNATGMATERVVFSKEEIENMSLEQLNVFIASGGTSTR